jgi:ribosomal protein S18 acetylase RimI-like enzyme
MKFGLGGNYRSLKALNAMSKYLPASPPHYYLSAIGTRQKARGRGLGSTLIQQTLQVCDRDRMPAYLENSKERNLKFYQSHGFEVREQISFGDGAPPMWLMWREPR